MSDKCKVTIIVPVYNMERYLQECIDSILDQTFQDFELILVDDGSTDRSAEMCDSYAKMRQRCRVIHKTNGGLSSARNAGIEVAEGDYIGFIDSDDCVARNYLEVLYENAVKYQADISYCDYQEWDGKAVDLESAKTDTFLLSQEEVWGYLSAIGSDVRKSMPIVIACGKLIRAELLQTLHFPEGVWHEDEFLAHRLLVNSQLYVGMSVKLYHYRQRTDSITGRDNRLDPRHLEVLNALEERVVYCRRFESRKLYVKMVSAYRNALIFQYFCFMQTKRRKNIKWRYMKSFLLFPMFEPLFWKRYAIFIISSKWYCKRYWKDMYLEKQ